MFGPDNPRYVSEWDYFEAERERDIREFHDDGGLNPYERELAQADIWVGDEPDEDLELFDTLHRLKQFNWTDQMLIEGRTATISVAKVKDNSAAERQAYAAAIEYKSTRLYLVLEESSVYEVVGVYVAPAKAFEYIEGDFEELFDEDTKQHLSAGIYSPTEAGEFVKRILPGLIFRLEREGTRR